MRSSETSGVRRYSILPYAPERNAMLALPVASSSAEIRSRLSWPSSTHAQPEIRAMLPRCATGPALKSWRVVSLTRMQIKSRDIVIVEAMSPSRISSTPNVPVPRNPSWSPSS